jgi:hypothetical protein
LVFVVPAPAIVPPDHVVRPDTVTVPGPWSVPLDRTSDVGLMAPTRLLALAVADPEIVSEPPLRLPPKFTVLPMRATVGTLTLEMVPRSWVPLANSRVVPADPVKAPGLVPPPLKLRVPDCTSTEPELLNGTFNLVVPAPTDFLNVAAAALMNGPAVPRGLVIVLSFWQSQVPLFVIDAPTTETSPTVQVVVPAVLSTREEVRPTNPLIAIPPLVFVVPAPAIVPPDHVVRPDTVTVSVPPSVPPEMDSVVGAIASPLVKFATPPEMVSALPTLETVPVGSKLAVAPLTVVPLVAA